MLHTKSHNGGRGSARRASGGSARRGRPSRYQAPKNGLNCGTNLVQIRGLGFRTTVFLWPGGPAPMSPTPISKPSNTARLHQGRRRKRLRYYTAGGAALAARAERRDRPRPDHAPPPCQRCRRLPRSPLCPRMEAMRRADGGGLQLTTLRRRGVGWHCPERIWHRPHGKACAYL